jgi:hypothetical protein
MSAATAVFLESGPPSPFPTVDRDGWELLCPEIRSFSAASPCYIHTRVGRSGANLRDGNGHLKLMPGWVRTQSSYFTLHVIFRFVKKKNITKNVTSCSLRQRQHVVVIGWQR